MATAAYNFLPNEHSKESPFFILFGHDPRLPLAELLQHKLRYLGTEETVLSLQALRNMYLVVAENLCKVHGLFKFICRSGANPEKVFRIC